jgi:hypothetical protein
MQQQSTQPSVVRNPNYQIPIQLQSTPQRPVSQTSSEAIMLSPPELEADDSAPSKVLQLTAGSLKRNTNSDM